MSKDAIEEFKKEANRVLLKIEGVRPWAPERGPEKTSSTIHLCKDLTDPGYEEYLEFLTLGLRSLLGYEIRMALTEGGKQMAPEDIGETIQKRAEELWEKAGATLAVDKITFELLEEPGSEE